MDRSHDAPLRHSIQVCTRLVHHVYEVLLSSVSDAAPLLFIYDGQRTLVNQDLSDFCIVVKTAALLVNQVICAVVVSFDLAESVLTRTTSSLTSCFRSSLHCVQGHRLTVSLISAISRYLF